MKKPDQININIMSKEDKDSFFYSKLRNGDLLHTTYFKLAHVKVLHCSSQLMHKKLNFSH